MSDKRIKINLLRKILLTGLVTFSFNTYAQESCYSVLSGLAETIVLPHHKALAEFEFPQIAEFETNEARIRGIIYRAFNGRDYYTGEKIPFHKMTLDHIIPRVKGGPSNIFNYVPTIEAENQSKGSDFGEDIHFEALEDVRDIYGPKIMKELERAGVLIDKQKALERKALKATKKAEEVAKREFRRKERNANRPPKRVYEQKEQGYYITFNNISDSFLRTLDLIIRDINSMSETEKENLLFSGELSLTVNDMAYSDILLKLEEANFFIIRASGSAKLTEQYEIQEDLIEVPFYMRNSDDHLILDLRINEELLKRLFIISKIEKTQDRDKALFALFSETKIERDEYDAWIGF